MPELDIFAMTMAVSVNLMALALAMPWFMEKKVSAAAKRTQQFLLLQGLAWMLLLGSVLTESPIWDAVLALLSFIASLISFRRLSRALAIWLGPRPKLLQHLLATCSVLGPLGCLALIQLPLAQSAWLFTSFGLCLFLVASMALRPQMAVGRLWRHILFGVGLSMGLSMGLILLLRGFLLINPTLLKQYVSNDEALQFLFSRAPQLGSMALLLAILLAWHDEAQRNKQEQRRQDPLTGLPLRHTLMQQAQTMLRRSQRSRQPFSLVLLSLDQFQSLSQQRGAKVGDEVLQLVSLVLQKQMRADEVAARWRDTCFCLLVHTDAAGVNSLLMRMQSAMQLGLEHELQLSLSFSACCVHVPEVWTELEFDDLVHEATHALQLAKKAGPGGRQIVSLQAPCHEEKPEPAPEQLACEKV